MVCTLNVGVINMESKNNDETYLSTSDPKVIDLIKIVSFTLLTIIFFKCIVSLLKKKENKPAYRILKP